MSCENIRCIVVSRKNVWSRIVLNCARNKDVGGSIYSTVDSDLVVARLTLSLPRV